MKANFGKRWEGATAWFGADLAPASKPMQAVFQFEFPESPPEEGTWRGWGVAQPGDSRVVPLSQATVLERTPGATTFEFDERAGGRSALQLGPAGAGLGVEVNFFYGARRSGVVLAYAPAGDGQHGSAGGEKAFAGAMVIAQREAPISLDHGATFVNSPQFINAAPADPVDLTSSVCGSPEAAAAATAALAAALREATYTRRSDLEIPGHALTSVDNPGDRPVVDWRSAEGSEASSEASGVTRVPLVAGPLPDGLWLRAPRVLDPARRGGCTVAVGCDARATGGGFRSVALLFGPTGALERVVCETYRWRSTYQPYCE